MSLTRVDACMEGSVMCGEEKGQYSWGSIKHLEFLYPQILRQTAPAERTLPIH